MTVRSPTARRTRELALALAVQSTARWHNTNASTVAFAKVFEAYLNGK